MHGSDFVATTETKESRFSFGLTELEVERFRDIMRRECGTELSMDDAWARAIELIALFRMFLGPLPEDSEAAPQFDHCSY